MTFREFQLTKGKKTLIWKIKQEGEKYITQHGQIDGAQQEFSDIPGSKGKEGTKAYVNAVDNCTFHISREIRKKLENGYIEFIDGKPTSIQVTSLDFNECLPKNFTGYKPQTSIEPAALEKLYKAGKARITRKYDGNQVIVYKNKFGWDIYTRRMDLTTERYPKHIEVLNNLGFSEGTILECEMVCFDKNNIDDFKAISRIGRSDPEVARKLIEDGEVPEPNLIVFDILFYNGTDLKTSSYDNRRAILEKHITQLGGPDSEEKYNLIDLARLYNVTPANWQSIAKEKGYEGYVVVNGGESFGDKFYSFDGDPKRPKGSWKLKPVYEEDVTIFAAVEGNGKRLGKVGALLTKQIHPETGKWFRTGKVGSGTTDDDLEYIEKLLKENNLPLYKDEKEDKSELDDSGIPCMIECSARQPGTNKFRFPVFIRIHNDKLPKECVAQKLAPEDE
jgi:ATP-dependent DNA ligase